jgi:DNA helicase HerA-like ATPase
MAKKAPRSTATKLNSSTDRPENISETLVARDSAADQLQRVQQAPGDAVAARPSTEPSDDDIRARAYEMYLERGGDHGLDFDDWVRAERELRQRR